MTRVVAIFLFLLMVTGRAVHSQGVGLSNDVMQIDNEINALLQNYTGWVCPILFDQGDGCTVKCPEGYRLVGGLRSDGSYVCKKESKARGDVTYCTYFIPVNCSIEARLKAQEEAEKEISRQVMERVLPKTQGLNLARYLVAIAMLDPRVVAFEDVSGLTTGTNVEASSATYRFFLKVYQIFIDTASDFSLLYFFILFLWSALVVSASAYIQKIRTAHFSMAGHLAGEFKSLLVRGALALLIFGLPVPSQVGNNPNSVVYVPVVVDFVRSMVYMGVEQADKMAYKINETFASYVTGTWVKDLVEEGERIKKRIRDTKIRIETLMSILEERCYALFAVPAGSGDDVVPLPKGYFASATDSRLEKLVIADPSWDNALSDEDQLAIAYACREYEKAVITSYGELISLREKLLDTDFAIRLYGQGGNEKLYEKLMAFYDVRFQQLGWIATPVVLPIFYSSVDKILLASREGRTVKMPRYAMTMATGEFGDISFPEEIREKKRKEAKEDLAAVLKREPHLISKALAYAVLPPGHSIFKTAKDIAKDGGVLFKEIITSFTGITSKVPFVGKISEKVAGFLISGVATITAVAITYLLMEFILSLLPFVALAIAFTLRFVFFLVDLIIFIMITPFYATWAVTLRRYEELGNYFVRALTLAVFPVAMVASVALALFASELISLLSYNIPQIFVTSLGDFKSQMGSGVMDTIKNAGYKFTVFFLLGVLFYVAKVASAILVFKFVFSAPEIMTEKLGQVVGGQGGLTVQLAREMKEHASRHVAPF